VQKMCQAKVDMPLPGPSALRTSKDECMSALGPMNRGNGANLLCSVLIACRFATPHSRLWPSRAQGMTGAVCARVFKL